MNAAPADTRAFWWMLLTAAMSTLPHLPYIASWLGSGTVVILAWQAWRIHRRIDAPRWYITTPLAIGAGVAVVITYQTLLGKQAGIALLVVLLSLKLLESRSPRDLRVCIFLAMFLQLGLFLDTESALTAAIAVLSALSAIATLISLSGLRSPQRTLKLAGTMMLQSVPFMLLLFFLFPRIPGPLWGLPEDAFAARTGLSDSMSPGSISELIQSGAVAFRVKFDESPPPRHQLYWRGPVLTNFDGRRWTPVKTTDATAPEYAVAGTPYRYTMTLEAHDKPWLLALDYPGPGVQNARYATDYRLLDSKRIQQRTRYTAESYPESRVGLNESRSTLAVALTLPPERNPRTIELARTLRASHESPEATLNAALSWMRTAGLNYTLRPPTLGLNTADEFLFDTKRGFCEHFASSFVILMRAAGIPARVVTGYQGGELNAYDGHLVVRQSDAHAWSEVWLEGRGWLRVDPTAQSHPARLDDGLAAALGANDAIPLFIRPDMQWLRDLRQRWDFVNNAWNQWVLGYDQARQQDFLSRLGLEKGNWPQLAGVLLGTSVLIMLSLLWWAHRTQRESDPLLRQWARFEHKLRRAGVPRLIHEGPDDYARRAGAALAAHRDAIGSIATQYSRLRYGRGTPERHEIQQLKSMIDRLKF